MSFIPVAHAVIEKGSNNYTNLRSDLISDAKIARHVAITNAVVGVAMIALGIGLIVGTGGLGIAFGGVLIGFGVFNLFESYNVHRISKSITDYSEHNFPVLTNGVANAFDPDEFIDAINPGSFGCSNLYARALVNKYVVKFGPQINN